MHVNHKIRMNLTGSEPVPTLEMVQHDQLTRQVELELYCGEEAFAIPENAGVLIHYLRPDGVSGAYDSLSDGSKAWRIAENILTVTLAPEVLTAEGTAALSARLIVGDRTLNTFTILIQIHKGLPSGELKEEGSICYYLAAPPVAAAGQFLVVASVDERGVITGLTAVDAPQMDTSFGVWGELYAQKLRVTSRFSTDSGITVNFGGNRLQGVSEPAADTDAATKAYVDQTIANALSGL